MTAQRLRPVQQINPRKVEGRRPEILLAGAGEVRESRWKMPPGRLGVESRTGAHCYEEGPFRGAFPVCGISADPGG